MFRDIASPSRRAPVCKPMHELRNKNIVDCKQLCLFDIDYRFLMRWVGEGRHARTTEVQEINMSGYSLRPDLARFAKQEFKAGRMDRRTFLSLSLAAGSATVLGAGFPGAARAAGDEVVFCNWGGDANTAFKELYAPGFNEATGLTLSLDPSGPYASKVEKMVETNSAIWDVTDSDLFDIISMAKKGLLEEIDYSVVDPKKMREGMAHKYAAHAYTYSFVLAYDKELVGDTPPTSWKDFWDLKAYPGRRAMWKYMSVYEPALLADGVDPNDLYPLDMARAAKKIKEIKDETIFYDSLAQGQQLFLDGEVSMAVLTSPRSTLVGRDTGGRVKINWNQAQMCPVSWPVIKGGPGGKDNAMKFIAFGQNPELQAKMFETIAYSPPNPAAKEHIAPEYLQDDPYTHADQQYWRDEEWYAANYGPMVDSILETIS